MAARAAEAFPIVDAHCHAGVGDLLGPGGDDKASLARYEQRAREAGIAGAVLFAPLTDDHHQANARAAGIARGRPGRYHWFLLIRPDADRGRVGALTGPAVAAGAQGLKVHWRDGTVNDEIGQAARRHRLPVIYDPRGDLGAVAWAARTFPDVAWIVPHLSSFADDWRAQRGFIPLLVRHPNLFTDTSGVRYFDVLAEAVARAGPGKVLFGSDGPLLHPGVEWAKIRAFGLPQPDLARVAGGNLLRLLPPRRARGTPSIRGVGTGGRLRRPRPVGAREQPPGGAGRPGR